MNSERADLFLVCSVKGRRLRLALLLLSTLFVQSRALAQELPDEFHRLRLQVTRLTEQARNNPQDNNLSILLGRLQARTGDLSGAKQTLAAALGSDSGNVPALTALGQVCRRMFDFQSALRLLEKAVALAPHDSAVRVLAAELSLDRMDFPAAASLYTTMLQENPAHPVALHGLAAVAYWDNRNDEAERLANDCLKADSAFAGAWLLKSLIHRIRQENNEWAACGRRAVVCDSLDDEARANLFNILIRGEQKAQEGYAHARIALALNPFNFTTHNYIGNGWNARTYPTLSVSLPTSERLRLDQTMSGADSALALHNLAQAAREYDRALTVLPDHIPALIGKGTTLYYQKRYDDALAMFFEVLALDPDYGLAHYGVAMTLLRKRDAVNVLLASLQKGNPADAPEPEALRDVFANYASLDPELQRIVRVSVAPLHAYLPTLKKEHVVFLIFPFHHFLWQVPFNKTLRGKRTFDGRLWDDVKGSGGKSACAGEEWQRDAINFRFNVLTHEFAHQVHSFLPKKLRDEITRLYNEAKRSRKTLDFYSDANENEYFAVGVEAYVSEYKLADQKITYGHTRQELLDTDPDLYRFIENLNRLAKLASPR